MYPDDRAVAAQQTERHRPKCRREELLIVPTVENALPSGAESCELGIERALGDSDDLVKPVHLRALNGLARRIAALVCELEGPPAAVSVLVGRGSELGHKLPTGVAGVDDVVARALEDVKVFLGEELDDEPPRLLGELIVIVVTRELRCKVVVSGI